MVPKPGQEIPAFQESLHGVFYSRRYFGHRLGLFQGLWEIHVTFMSISSRSIVSIIEAFVIMVIYPAGLWTWILIKKNITLN
jgi:hypothetical protein